MVFAFIRGRFSLLYLIKNHAKLLNFLTFSLMKKYLLTAILLTIAASQISAQKTKDVLYLKNGSIIYGRLSEIIDNNYKIISADGSVFVYSGQDVDKFIKESSSFEGRREEGIGFSMEAGLLIGAQHNEFEAPFSFNIILNYTNNSKNILGLGSGVEFLGSTFTPLFLEYKRLFFDRKTTPFIFFRGGTLIHIGGDNENDNNSYIYPQYNYPYNYKGGASLGFGTGISWARDESETYLSFGYRYAQTSYMELNYTDQKVTYKNYYNRLEVKLGFKF